MTNRRVIQHTPYHVDIEELRTDSDGNNVWAVIFCSEDEMNGYIATTPQEIRIAKLLNHVPHEYRARATSECYGSIEHEFERMLSV